MDAVTIEAAKRGIEIGILRGDLNLVKTAFDILWGKDPVSASRNWLRFNTPALITRNCFYLLGEYLEFYERLVDKQTVVNSPEEERAYRAFYYKLSAALKNKDAHALLWLGSSAQEQPEEKRILDLELVKFWEWLYYANVVNIEDAAEEVFLLLTHQKWPPGFLNCRNDPYLLRIVIYLKNIIQSVDLADNKRLYLAEMVIWGRRLADRNTITESWNSRINEFLRAPGITKPEKIPLPWYCYDPLTEIGKDVVRQLADGTWSESQIKQLWLLAESYRIKKSDLLIVDRELIVPGIVASVWWVPCLKSILEMSVGNDAKKLLQQWREELAPRAEKLVISILNAPAREPTRRRRKNK